MTTLSASVSPSSGPSRPAPVRLSNIVLAVVALFAAALLVGAIAGVVERAWMAGTLQFIASLLAAVGIAVAIGTGAVLLSAQPPHACCDFCGHSFPVEDLQLAVGDRRACETCCTGNGRVVLQTPKGDAA